METILIHDRRGVANIDLLKIDAEGYGRRFWRPDALASRRIKAILAECDFDPKDTQHTYFNDLWDYLRSKIPRFWPIRCDSLWKRNWNRFLQRPIH